MSESAYVAVRSRSSHLPVALIPVTNEMGLTADKIVDGVKALLGLIANDSSWERFETTILFRIDGNEDMLRVTTPAVDAVSLATGTRDQLLAFLRQRLNVVPEWLEAVAGVYRRQLRAGRIVLRPELGEGVDEWHVLGVDQAGTGDSYACVVVPDLAAAIARINKPVRKVITDFMDVAVPEWAPAGSGEPEVIFEYSMLPQQEQSFGILDLVSMAGGSIGGRRRFQGARAAAPAKDLLKGIL